MVKIEFRRCLSSDLKLLQRFVDQLYLADVAGSDAGRKPDIQLSFERLDKDPEKGSVIAIEIEGKVIGYCIVILFWSNEYRGDVLEIDEMFVDENYRRMGITTQMFKWLEEEFEGKIIGFALQVSEENAPALQTVEKLGFTPSRHRHFLRLR